MDYGAEPLTCLTQTLILSGFIYCDQCRSLKTITTNIRNTDPPKTIEVKDTENIQVFNLTFSLYRLRHHE